MSSQSAASNRRGKRFKWPMWMYKLASPAYFDDMAGRIIPWLLIPGLVLTLIGLVWGLVFAPPDYQQGDSFRIIYVHVPTAALSMGIYVAMASAAGIGLIWRIRLASVVARNCAPIGAACTFLALATGALWGKPMWGTYWVWDARLTSELILLFLYLGYMALHEAFEDPEIGSRAASILALVGVVNIPIIHYSVEWWYTLHQGATIFKLGKPSIESSMLWPLLIMLLAFALLSMTNVLMRTRNDVLESRLQPDDD